MSIFKPKRIGVALGGGGVRGLACLGVLKKLQKRKVKIKYLSGTSMGALVGALFAYYQDAHFVQEKMEELRQSPEFKKMNEVFADKLESMSSNKDRDGFREKFRRYFSEIYFLKKFMSEIALVKDNVIDPVINRIIPDVDIEDLPIKFCCVCTELTHGKEAVFKTGSLRKAVKGSIAVPAILEPMRSKGLIYSDGGSVSVTPAEQIREMGGNFVIAVDVTDRIRRKIKFKNGIEILERAHRVTSNKLNKKIVETADVVIYPPVKNIYWANFRKSDFCISAGESAALDKIKKL